MAEAAPVNTPVNPPVNTKVKTQEKTKQRVNKWPVNPDKRIDFIPSARRVRVEFNGETIVDTLAPMMMLEGRSVPVYYLPRCDVRMDLLAPTDHDSFCPYKGTANYFSIRAGGKVSENAVWSYQDPFPEVAAIKDYLAFYWDRVDHWYEEDDEIFKHPRDPYHRVDVVSSSRPVAVTLSGTEIAQSSRARFLYETNWPTRYYLPRDDVKMELLEPSPFTSTCPYKGDAVYFSARIDGELLEDVAWCYPDPIPECPKISDYICFFNERVDHITVDGVVQPKPETKWSRD